MALSETVQSMQELLAQISINLEKATNRGNKAAAQRVRTSTIQLEKIAKVYRKESVIADKSAVKKRKATKKNAALGKNVKAGRPVSKKSISKKTATLEIQEKPVSKSFAKKSPEAAPPKKGVKKTAAKEVKANPTREVKASPTREVKGSKAKETKKTEEKKTAKAKKTTVKSPAFSLRRRDSKRPTAKMPRKRTRA